MARKYSYKKVINVIENHAYPYIGNKPIETIIISDILNVIDRMNKKVYLVVHILFEIFFKFIYSCIKNHPFNFTI